MAQSYQETAAKASSNTVSSGPKYDELGMYGKGVMQTMESYSAFTGKAVEDAKNIAIAQCASQNSIDESNIEADLNDLWSSRRYDSSECNDIFNEVNVYLHIRYD